MKLSEFWFLMENEFGSSYARHLARDFVLARFGNITAQQAVDAGEDVREVWREICAVQDVPEERRWGPDVSSRS